MYYFQPSLHKLNINQDDILATRDFKKTSCTPNVNHNIKITSIDKVRLNNTKLHCFDRVEKNKPTRQKAKF